MQIFLDNIIYSLQISGGISAYWVEITKRILQTNDYKIKFIEARGSNTNIFRRSINIPNKNIIPDTLNIKSLTRYLPVWINSSDSLYIFHSSYLRFCKSKKAINIATVYDCTYELYGKGFSRLIHRIQKFFLLKYADVVICISKNTMNDLLYLYPWADKEKMKVVYLAAGNEYCPLTFSSFEYITKVHSSKSFLLYVGSRASYKNFDLVVRALESLTEYSLVFVGGGKPNRAELDLLKKIDGRYVHIPNLSNEELNKYYNSAFCLIYPSEYEGFGIPPLEAMMAGCPVIAKKGSSIDEVVGDAALLMTKSDFRQIIELVKELENVDLRRVMIGRGFLNASNFSWDLCFERTIQIYEREMNLRLENAN